MATLKVTTVRRARFHHGADVAAVAMTRDGGIIVTGGADARIRVWDAATGFVRATITAHSSAITCLVFTDDERFLVSGDASGNAAVSELATGTSAIRPIFSGGSWPLTAVAVAACGTLIFGAGSFVQQHDIYGDRDDPAQLRAFASIDELLLPSTDDDARGRLVYTFDDRAAVPSLHVEGDLVRVSGAGMALRSTAPLLDGWESAEAPPADRRAIEAWTRLSDAGTGGVVAVAGSAVLSADGSVTRGDATTKVVFPPEAFAFALGPAGEIVVGTKMGVLVTYEDGEARPFDDIHPEGVRSLAVSVDGRYAMSGGIDGHVRTWNLAKRQLIALSTGDPADAVQAIAANATHAFSGDRTGGTALWTLPSLEAPARFTSKIKSWWGLGAVAIDARGGRVAHASMTEVVVWDVKTGAVSARIQAGFAVQALAFRADGTLVVLEAHIESKLRIHRGDQVVAGCSLDGKATTMALAAGDVMLGFTDGRVVRVCLEEGP